jgi:Nucleotidyl transferase AbiEii toxin, Type IV TA system
VDQAELLGFVVDAMEKRGVLYAITGAQASSAHGENRFTNDIDIVVRITSHEQLNQLLAEFPSDSFYVSDIGAQYAVSHGGQFNIIHHDSQQKVDVILPRDPGWPDQLARRVQLPISETRRVWFLSPEDVILKKMDFYREGGSDKHIRDIAGILKIRGDKVDRAYIADWSKTLGLSEIWDAIVARIDR